MNKCKLFLYFTYEIQINTYISYEISIPNDFLSRIICSYRLWANCISFPQSSGNAKRLPDFKKKISIYAEDTTTFYLSLFRTEVLHNASVKWTKKASKAEIRWMTDSSLPPEGYRINISPRQMVIAASDKRGFTHAVQTLRQWVTGSTGILTFACADISDSPRTPWRCFC